MLVLSALTDAESRMKLGAHGKEHVLISQARAIWTTTRVDNKESGYLQVMAMNAHRAFSRVFGVAPHLDGAKLCRLVSVPASNIDRQINEHRIDSILKNVPLDSLETFDIRLDALDAIAVLL